MAGYYKYQLNRGDTGNNDVMRALTAARERKRAAGIPAVRDEAEDHYYVLEWSLTAAQRTLSLSQLSADRHASDACLKHLTGASDVTRCGSFAPAPASSDARTQLFKARVGLLEVFLVLDTADSHGGTARAATTTGPKDKPADVADPAPRVGWDKPADVADPAPRHHAVALVLRLKAQHTARGAAADKPPPRYYETAERPETQRDHPPQCSHVRGAEGRLPGEGGGVRRGRPAPRHRPAARALVWTGGPPCCRPGPGAAGGTGGRVSSGPGRGPDLRCPHRAGGALPFKLAPSPGTPDSRTWCATAAGRRSGRRRRPRPDFSTGSLTSRAQPGVGAPPACALAWLSISRTPVTVLGSGRAGTRQRRVQPRQFETDARISRSVRRTRSGRL